MLVFIVSVIAISLGAVGIALMSFIIWNLIRFKRGIYRIDPGPISGYADRYSFNRGELIDLYIHSGEPLVVTPLRLTESWEPVGDGIKLAAQLQGTLYDRRKGMKWVKSVSIDSSHLPPGLYQFLLQQESDRGARFSVPIIIKDQRPSRLGVVLTTNTWDAYNCFGGVSHYENHHHIRFLWKISRKFFGRLYWDHVPSRRPNSLFSDEVRHDNFYSTYSSFLVRNELQFLVFLAKKGYQYAVYDDRDLAWDPIVQQASVLVFCGHSEYWTGDMHYAFEQFVGRGGNVFRTIAGMEGTVAFTPLGLTFGLSLSQSVPNKLVGAHTDSEGSFTAAPFRVLVSDHRVFSGTGLRPDDLFGEESRNRPSFDIAGHRHLRNIIDLEGQPQNGASGFFTSKVGPGSGAFTILAIGTNPHGPAHMVYRDTPNGGWIFNASSLSFNGALLCDEVAAKIVCNLMDDAVGRQYRSRLGERDRSDTPAPAAWDIAR